MNENEEITPEMWARWYAHKSNKEAWIEQQEASEELSDQDS